MNDKILAKIKETAMAEVTSAQKYRCQGVEIPMSKLPGTYMEQNIALGELKSKGILVKEQNNRWSLYW